MSLATSGASVQELMQAASPILLCGSLGFSICPESALTLRSLAQLEGPLGNAGWVQGRPGG